MLVCCCCAAYCDTNILSPNKPAQFSRQGDLLGEADRLLSELEQKKKQKQKKQKQKERKRALPRAGEQQQRQECHTRATRGRDLESAAGRGCGRGRGRDRVLERVLAELAEAVAAENADEARKFLERVRGAEQLREHTALVEARRRERAQAQAQAPQQAQSGGRNGSVSESSDSVWNNDTNDDKGMLAGQVDASLACRRAARVSRVAAMGAEQRALAAAR